MANVTPMSERPNLDDDSDRQAFWNNPPDDAPDGMLTYCTAKTQAVKYRLAGNIEAAEVRERLCERIYKSLPRGWRW